MSGPPDKDPRTDPRADPRTAAQRDRGTGRGAYPPTLGERPPGPSPNDNAGETSGDFGLDRAIERLQAELNTEPVAGPSAVDVLGSAAIRVGTPQPGTTGKVVGAPPVALGTPDAALSHHDLMPSDSATSPMGHDGLDRGAPASETGPLPGDPFNAGTGGRPVPAGQSQVGMGGDAPAPHDYYGRDSPLPSLPAKRPGVQEPVFTPRAEGRSAASSSALAGAPRPVAGGRVAAVGVSAADGPVGGWRPPSASESAIASYARPPTPPPTDVGALGPDGKTEPVTPLPKAAAPVPPPQQDFRAERTAVLRSPSPKVAPRPWVLYAIVGGVIGGIAVAMLLRFLS